MTCKSCKFEKSGKNEVYVDTRMHNAQRDRIYYLVLLHSYLLQLSF